MREGRKGASLPVRPAAMRKRSVAALCAAAVSLVCLLQAGCDGWTFPPVQTASFPASAAVTAGGATGSASPGVSAGETPTPTPSDETPTPAPEGTPTPEPTASPPQSIVALTTERLRISDELVEVELEYPVVSGMADGAFETAFNASVLADMQAQADMLRLKAADASGDVLEGEEFRKFTLESKTKVEYQSQALFSVSMSLYAYAGGAHGTSDSRYYTVVNAVPAMHLTLPELFADRAEGLSRVQDAIELAIGADADNYFDPPGATVGEDTWFYLTDTGLHVVFPAYSIAPGAMGEPEFRIPLAELEDFLIPELGY